MDLVPIWDAMVEDLNAAASRAELEAGPCDVPKGTDLAMTFGPLLAFRIARLIAVASPGPALPMAIKASLNGSRRTGAAVRDRDWN